MEVINRETMEQIIHSIHTSFNQISVAEALWNHEWVYWDKCWEQNSIRQLKQSKILPYNFAYLLEKTPAFFTKVKSQALNSWMRKIQYDMAQTEKG